MDSPHVPAAMNPAYFPCAGSRARHAPTRREFVYGLGASLGGVALTAQLAAAEAAGPLAPKAQQVPARAKNCIFLMMEGRREASLFFCADGRLFLARRRSFPG